MNNIHIVNTTCWLCQGNFTKTSPFFSNGGRGGPPVLDPPLIHVISLHRMWFSMLRITTVVYWWRNTQWQCHSVTLDRFFKLMRYESAEACRVYTILKCMRYCDVIHITPYRICTKYFIGFLMKSTNPTPNYKRIFLMHLEWFSIRDLAQRL